MTSLALPLLAAAWLGASAPALHPNVSTHPRYGETFTFVADLDDGSYAQVSFGFTNIGPGSLKAICRVVLVQPDGTPWKASTRVGREAWSWHDDGGERLAVGPCSASVADGETRVEVPLDGAAFRLAFAARPERRATPDPLLVVGGDAYRVEVLLPRAPVSGSIALPGAPPRPVSGGGYLDHSRSTVKGKDLALRWIRFRALRGRAGLIVLAREGHDGSFGPAWACDEPGTCRRYRSFTVERSGPANAPAFRLTLAGDAVLALASDRLIYRDAPVEEMGVLGKIVAPFFGSPVTYVYRARASPDGPSPVDGILEVELASE